MADPMAALNAFQRDFEANRIPLQRAELHPNVFMTVDFPNNRSRFIYLTLEQGIITAIALFALVEIKGREPLFQLGVAVHEAHRGSGLGKRLVKAAIEELSNGSARSDVPIINIEAVVAADNAASNKIMAKCISPAPTPITDSESNESAFHYLGRFGS